MAVAGRKASCGAATATELELEMREADDRLPMDDSLVDDDAVFVAASDEAAEVVVADGDALGMEVDSGADGNSKSCCCNVVDN